MVALKKFDEAPLEDNPEAVAEGAAEAAVPAVVGLNREKETARLKVAIATSLNSIQREALGLLAIALAFADEHHADETHPYLRTLNDIYDKPVTSTLIRKLTEHNRQNRVNVVELFDQPLQQATLLQTLHFLSICKAFYPGQETSLNYQQLQKKLDAQVIFNDIISFFVQSTISRAKIETPTAVPKADEIIKNLLEGRAPPYNPKELTQAQYIGYWKSILERCETHIQELQKKALAHKPVTKSPDGFVKTLQVNYSPYSLTKNKILEKLDKDISFPTTFEENDAYTMLGIIGHAASADGAETDAMEARLLKDLMGRMHFKIDRQAFSTSAALPLDQLLSQVKSPEMQHAIYYETMCMMTSNLEITPEEKAMLNVVAEKFKFPDKITLLLHTRHYLDSGIRGLEDSLQSMPVMLNSAHHSLHRFQEALSELAIVPLPQIVASGKAYLESMEPMKLPANSPVEIKVVALSLVGNAMRLDNVFDDAEKAFLMKTMSDLGLTSEDLKAHSLIMKQSSLADLCAILKIWGMSKKNAVALSAVAYFVLRAISADGVIDEAEDKFKNQFFRELGLESSQYVRILLRAQLDLVD